MYSCAVVQFYRCTVVQLYRCTVVQLNSCAVVQLYSCTVVQSYSCTVVQVYSCAVVQLNSCTDVQLHLGEGDAKRRESPLTELQQLVRVLVTAACTVLLFFSLLLSSLELSDTKIYEP